MKPIDKPVLRGYFHEAAFFVSLGACAMLTAKSHGHQAFPAALIFSLSLCTLFGISALYHRVQWKPQKRAWMRRLDHASIFILIAGTSTAICLLTLSGENKSKFTALIWIAAIFGILQSLFWVHAPKWVSSILYVGVGCLALPYLPEFYAALGLGKITLLLSGGALYVLGAAVYATKFPNPWPRYFGYHEIFHILVVVAAALHFVLISNLIG